LRVDIIFIPKYHTMNRLLFITLSVFIINMVNADSLLSQGFKISGTKLLDANGKEFIIRGVNNPHAWYVKQSYESLDKIAELKANCVRIVWQLYGRTSQLDSVIQRCIELEMIPMIELHDATGSPKAEKLLETVSYYAKPDVKEVLLKYDKYLLINLANEWGDYFVTAEYWKTSYMQAIDMLRKAGIKTTLVIDGPAWGQRIQPIIQYGKALLDYDPQKNLLFSVHVYYLWSQPVTIDTALQKVYDASLPLIIGEFGYNYNKGENNLKCTVDHKSLLHECQELGIGYIAWSWAGNDNLNSWLDLSDWKTLTWWGKEIFEKENGITSTSKKASVFLHKE
jgi:mannan endo-1,4-beta-mannosidase